MNGFALLCRVQVLALVNSLAPERQGSKRRSRTARLALAGVVAIALGALMAAYVALMGMGLVAMGLTEVIPAFALVVGSLAGIVFAFMKARGTLFGLADWDHVMSLPISRRAVVASRLGTVFLAAIVLSAVFMTPLFVVYFLHAPANPESVIFAVLSIPLAPLAPVSASVFAAFGVTMLTVRFRHANLAYIVLALAFFTLIFVGAYALSFSAGTASDPAAKLAAFGSVASAMGAGLTALYPPAAWACEGIISGSALPFVVFAAFSLGVALACLEIMQRLYLPINGLLASKGGARDRYTAERLRERRSGASPFRAMMNKEFRTLIGIPSYAFNCLFGYILMVVVAVALSAMGMRELLTSGVVDGVEITDEAVRAYASRLVVLIPWVYVFCTCMCPSAACSISLEGRSAWLMSTVPVPPCTVLGAKLAANALPAAITLAISAIVLVVSGEAGALQGLEIVVLGFGVFYLLITSALSVDAASPNFAWNTPNEVVKRSMPIMVTVFGGMAAAFGGGFACWMLMDTLGAAAAGDALNLGLGVACAAAGHLVFRRLCHRTALFTR